MKFFKKHKFVLPAIVATAASVFACMTIDDIIFPDNPQVDSDIEITVKCKLVTESDDKAQFVFAVLAPKSWSLKDNATLTFTTRGYETQGGTNVVDEPMVIMTDADHEPSTDQTWPQAYQSNIGVMGNTGSVEWTVYHSTTVFNISDKVSTEPIYADVKIKLHTGKDNIKFFMGFGFCEKNYGFNTDRYKANETAKVMEVTGGSGPVDDYTTVKYVSTIPSVFRYGDIFSIQFASTVGDTPTELYDAENPIEEIYLCAKAVLTDGTEIVVEKIDDDHLMQKTSDITYQKYIYPKTFFGLTGNQTISETYFYFYNKDKSKKFKPDDVGFQIVQSAE